MTSITAQQNKLDLELVPKENRLDIGKCNGRIPRGLKPKEETFQVVLDALALTPCYPAFLITADVPEVYMHQFWNCIYKHDDFYRFKIDKKKRFKLTLEVFRDIFQICPRVPGRDFDALPSEEDTISFLRDLGHTRVINSLNDVVVDQMHQPWRTFDALINRSLSGKTTGLDKLRLSRAQILWGMYHQKNVDYVELLWEDFTYQIDNKVYKKNRIGMHTSKDDYLINTLRFVSRREASQKYGAVIPECLTSPEMKESKAYKTYLSYATGAVPPKVARKFKKASPTKKDSVPVQADEEPVQKGKRVKRAAKKPSNTPATGIVIREPTVETKSKRKEKEKVDVAHGKGIELLSDVALTEEAQMKEVHKKSLRDFHKTHPSGSGTVAEDPPRVAKITPTVTSEGTGEKPGVPDVTNDDSSESESESWGNDEDDSNNEQESSDESSKQENDSDEQELDLEQDEESNDDDQEQEGGVPTGIVQGTNTEMTEAQQGNENLETTQEQVVEDAHVTIFTVPKKTEVPVTMSPLDIHVHHEVPRTQAPTLLTIPVSVIPESSPVFTNIPQSSHTFTPTPIQTTPTPPPTIETTNPLSNLPDFSSVFRFNDRITALEKEVVDLKKDPLHTQVTSLVDSHLDTRLGETRQEFMNFLSESLTARIKEQLIKESRDEVTLAKASSQPQSTYEAASTLTEFELKKILLDKMEKSESYLTAPEHRDCYDGLKKSYALDKDFFYSYDEYSLKRSRKDKDEDPSAGSDRGLKKRKLSKDTKPTTEPKKKDSTSGSSKGTKSQPKSSGKSVQSEEPVFEVADSDLPQDQEGNLGDNEDEPRKATASRSDWFKKPTPTQEPTDPDWNIGKTTKEGPTQTWLMNLAASNPSDKSLKDFDELMSTPIDFSSFVLNGLKIKNLTQEILLGPAFRLLKGTRSNYAELEYDFEECYKALSEKLDWENPEGGDYPFDLSKPLPLITHGNRQRVPFEFFINNDLKYLQGGVSTMTYTTSTTKSKVAKYDLPGIEDMVPNIWSPVKVAYDKYALWGISHWREQLTHVKVMRKHGYGYLEEIVVRRADNILYRFKEGDFPRLRINDIEDMLILVVQNRLTNLSGDDVADFAITLRMFTRSLVIQKRVEDLQLGVESYQKKINVTKPDTTRPDLRKRHPYTPYKDPQGFIYVDDIGRNRLMRSDELYKFSDGTLTRLLSSLEDITKNIDMTYLPKRRWSTLEKKRAHFMIKDINKLLKERRMMRSLEKFVGGRLYGTDLRLLQRTI
ncbi:hypothetical protein Tco_1292206 [Tanacetum coccineum]